MTYSVKLPVYEGPLELLLELISKERVDPAEVSISTITDEYLRAVASMGNLDLDLATKFLVLAATLLELKSLKLLPGKTAADEDVAALLEERDHLVHRLIEYSTFKGVAAVLAEAFAANGNYFYRCAQLPEELREPPPDPVGPISAASLAAAARRALSFKPAPVVDTGHVTPITISTAEAVAILVRQIESAGTITFGELCRVAASRVEIVVRFLALLEMHKDQSIELEQEAPFGEILVRHRRPASEAVG